MVVTDFYTKAKHRDTTALAFDGFDSFVDLKHHVSQRGNQVLLTFDNGDSLTQQHVNVHDLSSADFIFSRTLRTKQLTRI